MFRLASLGLTPSDTVMLEVNGCRSGRAHPTAVTWVEQDGERYPVSPRGESEWVRNVRAAKGDALIRHRGQQQVRLLAVPVEQRPPILQAYLRKTARATRKHFGLDREAAIEEFERIAARHPVLRIVSNDS